MEFGLVCNMLFPLFFRYAIRESNSVVKIFKNFKEKKSFKPDFGAESECYLFMTHFENFCNGSEYVSRICVLFKVSTGASCWESGL